MLNEEKKTMVVVAVANREEAKKKKQMNGPAISPAKGDNANITYEVQVQFSPSDEGKKQRHQKNGSGGRKWETVFKISEKNQLHPNSIFQNDRRNSFSNYCGQIRKASYDRNHLAENTEMLPGTERRASYDVSYLSRAGDTLSVNDDVKTSRRGSLVQRWLRRISDAADGHKKDGKQKAAVLSVHDLDHCANGSESPIKTKENDRSHASGDTNTPTRAAGTRQSQDDGHGNESTPKKSGGGGLNGTSPGLKKTKIPLIEPPRLTTEIPLIEPSQVLISQQAVLTAEPVLTPLEKVRRNYETINELLSENNKLVANILHVTKDDSEATSDSCKPVAYDKEATELVRSAINEVDQLTALLNECLRVTDENVIAANCEVNVGGANSAANVTSGSAFSIKKFPSVPVSKLNPITQALRNYHTVLLTVWKEREEERERHRQELQRSREQLHAMHETQQRMQRISDQTQSSNESAQNSSKEGTTKESSKDVE